MKKRSSVIIILFLFLIAAFICTSCGTGSNNTTSSSPTPSPSASTTPSPSPTGFYVLSSAFQDEGDIALKYAHTSAGGSNISIPLAWYNAPVSTNAFMITMLDPDASNFVHWCAVNIPSSTTSLNEGASPSAMPSGTVEIRNDFGELGYGGPAPPSKHLYVITIYALSGDLSGISETSSYSEVMSAASGKILDQTSISAYYTP